MTKSIKFLMLAVMMASVASVASADIIEVPATKDLKFGKDRDAGGNVGDPFVDATGDLALRSFSSAKLSNLIGGFDLSQFESITSATVNIYVIARGGDASGGFRAYAVTMDWDNSLTLGDLDLNPDGSLASGFSTEGANEQASWPWGTSQGTWQSLDVTSIVTNWQNETVGSSDRGLLITGGVWNNTFQLGSTETEGDFAPYLAIEGTLVPEPASLLLIGCGAMVMLGRRQRAVS